MFINYDPNNGITINSYRDPAATAGDIVDLVIDGLVDGHTMTCWLDGAKDALEDGELWKGTRATIHALEEIHNVICEYEYNTALYCDHCSNQIEAAYVEE